MLHFLQLQANAHLSNRDHSAALTCLKDAFSTATGDSTGMVSYDNHFAFQSFCMMGFACLGVQNFNAHCTGIWICIHEQWPALLQRLYKKWASFL